MSGLIHPDPGCRLTARIIQSFLNDASGRGRVHEAVAPCDDDALAGRGDAAGVHVYDACSACRDDACEHEGCAAGNRSPVARNSSAGLAAGSGGDDDGQCR